MYGGYLRRPLSSSSSSLVIDRVSIVADEKGSDSLDERERVQLVQRADVRLEELEVVHVGEGLAKLGQVGDEVVEGHEVELQKRRGRNRAKKFECERGEYSPEQWSP